METEQTRPDYYSIKMLSNSSLKLFSDNSPRTALYLMENGIKETDALIFGRYVHSCALEPDTIDKEYHLLPEDFNLRTKANKELYQEILASGKMPIKWAMQQTANEMMDRIFESKNAKMLLKGIPEKEYFATIDGIEIKSKVDLVNPEKGYILDLKTTLNAEPNAFIKEMENRKYFQQAWLYREMANLNGENITKFFFLNIIKEKPYTMSIIEVSDEQFQIGEAMFRHSFSLYKQALKTPDKDFDSFPAGQRHFCYDTPLWISRKYLGDDE